MVALNRATFIRSAKIVKKSYPHHKLLAKNEELVGDEHVN